MCFYSVEMQSISIGSMCFELPRALKNSRQSRMWFTDFCNFVWHRQGQSNISGLSRTSPMLFCLFSTEFWRGIFPSCHINADVCRFYDEIRYIHSFDKYFHAISKHQSIESEWSKIIKNNKSLIIVVLNVSFISVFLAFCFYWFSLLITPHISTWLFASISIIQSIRSSLLVATSYIIEFIF